MTKPLDPLDVNGRLYRQIGALLDQLEQAENLGVRDRIAALVAIGRIQTMFVGLRKETKDDRSEAGSAVRKFKTAFTAAPGARKPKRGSGPTAVGKSEIYDTDDDDIEEVYRS
jgi:hypothetical protein